MNDDYIVVLAKLKHNTSNQISCLITNTNTNPTKIYREISNKTNHTGRKNLSVSMKYTNIRRHYTIDQQSR